MFACAATVTNSDAVNSLKDRMRGKQPAAEQAGHQQWQRHGHEHTARFRAEARRCQFKPLIEIAQRNVNAAQHEGRTRMTWQTTTTGIAARGTDLGGQDQQAEADREMRHHQRRQQQSPRGPSCRETRSDRSQRRMRLRQPAR